MGICSCNGLMNKPLIFSIFIKIVTIERRIIVNFKLVIPNEENTSMADFIEVDFVISISTNLEYSLMTAIFS